MKSFEQLLDVREFTATYRGADTLQSYPFTNTFWKNPRNVESDSVEMISISGVTSPAPGNVRDGVAKVITPRGASKKQATLFRIFNEITAPGDALKALREPESPALQDKGRMVVQLANEEILTRNRMFKEVCFSQILTVGRVNLDQNGNPLAPSAHATTGVITNASGTAIAADFGIADTHRGNCNGIMAAAWSTAGTKISDQLEAFREDALANGAEPPTEIYIRRKQKKHLRANTEFNDWAKYNSSRAVDSILKGDIIEDLWGFNWHFVDGFWTDVNGTQNPLMPLLSAIICPANGPWLRALQGSELVPTEIGMAGNWKEALNMVRKVYGEFAYAMVKQNPVALQFFYGDNFGLHYANTNSIYMPTVFAS